MVTYISWIVYCVLDIGYPDFRNSSILDIDVKIEIVRHPFQFFMNFNCELAKTLLDLPAISCANGVEVDVLKFVIGSSKC